MAKQEVTIILTLEYDPAKNNNTPVNIFLFRLLNRLDREHKILELTYKGIKKLFRSKSSKINNIVLNKVDSLDENDLPEPPEYLKDFKGIAPRPPKKEPPAHHKDRTILEPRKTKKISK